MTNRRVLHSVLAALLALVGLITVASSANAVVLTCGSVLGSEVDNTTMVLTANIGPCSTDKGILINFVNNFTLDLNGHSIIGNGAIAQGGVSENGIYVFGSNNITIRNGTITKWNNGIFLDGSAGGANDTITRMRLVDNIGPDATAVYGEGIQSLFVSGNTITNNQVVHNGPFSGINLYSSRDNIVRGNQVVNNNIPSDEEHHGSGPLMQDIGIWIINLFSDVTFSANNTVTSNSLAGNGLDGVQLSRFAFNNTVTVNSSVNNGFGQLPGTVIPARSPSCADGDGIANFGNLNQIRSNSTVHNGGNGIAVYRSGSPAQGQRNTIQGNRSFQNGTAANCVGKAFDLFDANLAPPCDTNTWSGNIFGTKSQVCIF